MVASFCIGNNIYIKVDMFIKLLSWRRSVGASKYNHIHLHCRRSAHDNKFPIHINTLLSRILLFIYFEQKSFNTTTTRREESNQLGHIELFGRSIDRIFGGGYKEIVLSFRVRRYVFIDISYRSICRKSTTIFGRKLLTGDFENCFKKGWLNIFQTGIFQKHSIKSFKKFWIWNFPRQ